MILPGTARLTVRALARRLYLRYQDDMPWDSAAQVGYYLLFGMFPFLLFVATLAAYLPLGPSIDEILGRLRMVAPGQALAFIDDNLRSLGSVRRPSLLTFGVVASVWSASRAVESLRRAMNAAYGANETRPYGTRQLIAIAMTIAGSILVLLGIMLLVAGSSLGHWLAGRLGVEPQYLLVVHWLRWPLTALLVATVMATGYYLLPNVRQPRVFFTPGTVIGTLLWLAVTWSFSYYVTASGSFDLTYGTIGGALVLLTWIYLSGFIFILGGEINSILNPRTASGPTTGQPAPAISPRALSPASATDRG